MSSAQSVPPGSTDRPSGSPDEAAPREAGRFFGLSTTQVAGSALAAATSALAASFLGVAGTIVGAVVGSLVATTASAVYAHSLRRAGARLRVVRPTVVTRTASARRSVVHGPRRAEPTSSTAPLAVPGRDGDPSDGSPQAGVTRPDRLRRSWPRVVAGVAAGVVMGAGLALGGITALEQVLGHPVSDAGESGTSVGSALSGGSSSRVGVPEPAPTKGPTATPTPGEASAGPGATPSPSGTATVEPPVAPSTAPPSTSSSAPSTSAPTGASGEPSAPASQPPVPGPGAGPAPGGR